MVEYKGVQASLNLEPHSKSLVFVPPSSYTTMICLGPDFHVLFLDFPHSSDQVNRTGDKSCEIWEGGIAGPGNRSLNWCGVSVEYPESKPRSGRVYACSAPISCLGADADVRGIIRPHVIQGGE